MDERLVGVAFLDVGVYVTSLQAVKNLLVIGDASKSVWFVGFQVSCGVCRIHCPTDGDHRRTHSSWLYWRKISLVSA